MNIDWGTLIPALGLLGGPVGAYVMLRRLSGQRALDAATRDDLISQAYDRLLARAEHQLEACQRQCAELRARMEHMERRVRQLEDALEDAGVPIPP